MADIMTPALGESVTEATVAKWTKKAGDAVRKDEILVELETDKVSLEVAAPSDGVLSEIASQPPRLRAAIISRVKIMARLNIAERRLPQDGAARIRVSRAELDVRVATMPTQGGESAVIRLLPRDVGEIGFTGGEKTVVLQQE